MFSIKNGSYDFQALSMSELTSEVLNVIFLWLRISSDSSNSRKSKKLIKIFNFHFYILLFMIYCFHWYWYSENFHSHNQKLKDILIFSIWRWNGHFSHTSFCWQIILLLVCTCFYFLKPTHAQKIIYLKNFKFINSYHTDIIEGVLKVTPMYAEIELDNLNTI